MTNEHTSLGKIYLSHFTLERVVKGLMLVLCERWLGEGTDCHILIPSSSVLEPYFFLVVLGCSIRFKRAHALCLAQALTTASCPQLRQEFDLNYACLELQLTQAVCGTWLYNCLTSTCFLWKSTGQGDIPISSTGCTCFLIDGRVEGQYITYICMSLCVFMYVCSCCWKFLIWKYKQYFSFISNLYLIDILFKKYFKVISKIRNTYD